MKRAITLLAVAVTLSAAASAQASRHEYGEYGEHGRGYSRGYESRTKFYGNIDAMPSSGIWMVSGRQVAISPSTRIKEKYGRVAPGAYVKIEGYHSNGGFTAYEIEVKGGSGGYRYR